MHDHTTSKPHNHTGTQPICTSFAAHFCLRCLYKLSWSGKSKLSCSYFKSTPPLTYSKVLRPTRLASDDICYYEYSKTTTTTTTTTTTAAHGSLITPLSNDWIYSCKTYANYYFRQKQVAGWTGEESVRPWEPRWCKRTQLRKMQINRPPQPLRFASGKVKVRLWMSVIVIELFSCKLQVTDNLRARHPLSTWCGCACVCVCVSVCVRVCVCVSV